MVRKRKCKKEKIYGEAGEFILEYNDFLVNEEDMVLYNKFLKKFRNKFYVANDASKMIDYLYSAMYVYAIKEIINFYNNDICIEVAKIFAMSEGKNDYNFRVIMNSIDTVSLKICSCWEYIIQVLNQYFMLELNSLRINRDILDKMYEKKMIFVDDENITKIEYIEWSEEERNLKEEKLSKIKKVLDTRGYGKRFKKDIRKAGYVVSDRIQEISILYSAEKVKLLKERVRNIITHKKSATFTYAISGLDGVIPKEGLAMMKAGWIEIDEFKDIISDNIDNLKMAIQIAYDIICLEDKLIHKGNENKEYYICLVECPECKHKTNVTSRLYSSFEKHEGGLVCTQCGNVMKKISEGKTSEYSHNQVLLRQIEEYVDYLKGRK